MARNIPGAVHRSITGIIHMAAETGCLEAAYNFTIRRAQNLVNDPDTANRVVRGIQRVRDLRNQ